jgi:phosphoglycolate phosphatase-like HAD superfamily hydrolase
VDVFALDFDGVLVDSASETAISAWRAGQTIWPEWQGPQPPEALLQRFRRLRPVLETGHEAIVLMRLVHQGVADEIVLEGFPDLCREVMPSTHLSAHELTARFGRARDAWIAADLNGWLARQRFYPQVLEPLRQALRSHPVYILTTKQQRFALTLLGSVGLDLGEDRIFGLESARPKEDVLKELMRSPALAGGRFHFVEDRLATLERVLQRGDLAEVRLYLAAWGYNTPQQRARAAAGGRIRVWTSEQFLQM